MNKRGFIQLMLAPAVLITVAIVIGLLLLIGVFSLAFSTKFLLFAVLVGAMIVAVKKGVSKNLWIFLGISVASVIAISLIGGLLMLQPMSVIDTTDSSKISMSIDDVAISPPATLGAMKFLAPSTYRSVDVTLKNSDASLPLVLKNDVVLVTALPCENATQMKALGSLPQSLCTVKQGGTILLQQGMFRDIAKSLFTANRYKVGVSEISPNKWEEGILDFTKIDDMDFRAMTTIGAGESTSSAVVLWDSSACEQFGDKEELAEAGIYCSELSAEQTIKKVGYVYALNGASYGTYKVRIFLLQPIDRGALLKISQGILGGQELWDAVVGKPYSIMAVDEDTVQVVPVSVQILINVAGIGIILFALWRFGIK